MSRLPGQFLAVLIWAVLAAATAGAQGLFSTVAEVGDRIITGYELQQRARLLELQGTTEDLQRKALEALIDERLQMIAAERAGIEPTPEQVRAAIAEIAARTDRDADKFLSDLAAEGVAPELFVESTRAGVAWRSLVQRRFGARATVTEAEIDRELSLGGRRGVLEFRFAEIFLPTNTPNNARITQELIPQIRALTTAEQFSEAARQVSVGGSRENGGLIDRWIKITDLPPALQSQIVALRIGEVSEPVEFPGAVGLFQLRAKREARVVTNPTRAVDFITYRIFGTADQSAQARARAVQARMDNCLDLFGIARGAGEDVLQRQTLALDALPRDVALEIAKLDPGESSIALSPDGGQSVTLIALCARLPSTEPSEEDRAQIRRALVNRKIAALADAYLQELRGETVITLK